MLTKQERIGVAIEEARGGLLWIGVDEQGIAIVANSDGSDPELLGETREEIERQIAARF